MKLNKKQHLTYCLNVHAGEKWNDNLDAIRDYSLKIRDAVAPDIPFGLGLRISNQALLELNNKKRIAELKSVLSEHKLYVFTVNAFPYGLFHNDSVKENVYMPDWRCEERESYTRGVADILSQIIPEGETASISTVPCSYKSWIKSEQDVKNMVIRLMNTVAYLVNLKKKTARMIHLGLEPEPDCYLETTDDVLAFFNGPIREYGFPYLSGMLGVTEEDAACFIGRHLGICFDTCHIALQFENLSESIKKLKDADILISKVQISSAISMQNSLEARKELMNVFNDPVYLHQIKAEKGEIVTSYTDIEPALENTEADVSEWRVHFHVPLYFEKYGVIGSTINELTPEFFKSIRDIEHLEIETYTFDVLPPDLRSVGIVQSVIDEYGWVISHDKLMESGSS